MIILRFIGASPSSTGGGIKTTTMGVVMATVFASLKGRPDVEIFERRVSQEIVYRALAIMTLALGWVYAVTLIMSLVEPFDFIRLLFETMSAFGTVGLTTGITPNLTDLSRVLLIVTMFIGRVGILTVTLALAKFHDSGSAKYIEEKIIIG
jgi:trk system potassium uptake protein TrkH